MKNLVVLFFLPYTFFAQKAIIIPIETENNALVLCTDKDNHLNTCYFGKKLYQSNDYAGIEAQYNLKDESGLYNSVYTSSGSGNLMEPALTLTHSDGNTSTELKYVSHSVTKKTDDITVISILLRDEIYPIEVTLYYKTYNKENVIIQWSEIKNNETGTIELKKYASANLYFSASNYFLTHYHGIWGREMKPEETQLTAGIKTLDTKLGTRAALMTAPSFQIAFDKPATEDEGKVLLGQMAWTGNFKIDFEYV